MPYFYLLFRIVNKDDKFQLQEVGTYTNGKIDGPCWTFTADERFIHGTCQGAPGRLRPGSEVIVGYLDNTKAPLVIGKLVGENILKDCKEATLDRLELNENCIQVSKLSSKYNFTNHKFCFC